MITIETITHTQVHMIRSEAVAKRDERLTATCDAALDHDLDALGRLVDLLNHRAVADQSKGAKK